MICFFFLMIRPPPGISPLPRPPLFRFSGPRESPPPRELPPPRESPRPAVVGRLRLPVSPRSSSVSASRPRSEEHTSELQSRQYLVCRLLLEKKKQTSGVSLNCRILTLTR